MALVDVAVGTLNAEGLVGAGERRAGVGSEEGDGAGLLERETKAGSVGVLEEDNGLAGDLADKLGVVAADVTVLGGGGLRGLLAVVETDVVVSNDVADDHIVEAGLGEAAVVDAGSEDVLSPVVARAVVETGIGGAVGGRLRVDIGEDEAEETEFLLEELADKGVVLAREGVVDTGHAAHDGHHTGLDTVGKGPGVELVDGLVVGVGGVDVGGGGGDTGGSVGLLLVEKEVAATGNDTGRVHAGDGLTHGDTGEVGVGTESLGGSSAVRGAAERAGLGSVDEVVAHAVELVTDGLELLLDELTVPAHGQGVGHAEARDVELVVDAGNTILVVQGSPGGVASDTLSGDDGNLGGGIESRDKGLGLLVGIVETAEGDC